MGNSGELFQLTQDTMKKTLSVSETIIIADSLATCSRQRHIVHWVSHFEAQIS